jgi:hypothetical protein
MCPYHVQPSIEGTLREHVPFEPIRQLSYKPECPNYVECPTNLTRRDERVKASDREAEPLRSQLRDYWRRRRRSAEMASLPKPQQAVDEACP